MGDRYYITVECPECGTVAEDVYYAPTCGFIEWACAGCSTVINLERYTGISYEDASNADAIRGMIRSLQGAPGDA